MPPLATRTPHPCWLLTLALAACGDLALPPAPAQPADLRAMVDAKKVDKGQPIALTVRSWTTPGWTVPAPTLTVEGLEATPGPAQAPVRVGEGERLEQRWALAGEPGSYVIDLPPVTATGPGGQTLDIDPPPIFVDIGVQGPAASGLSDFEAEPPPEPPPWGLIGGAGAATLALAGLGFWLWRRSRRPAPDAPPLPPHEQLLLDWQQAQARAAAGALDDHGLALALSTLFRRYLEAVLGFPATARTTREILHYLRQNQLLGESDRNRARDLLDATDRLKFAREGGGAAFFADLDSNLRAVVDATRPRAALPAEAPHA